jgi:hypothetical protein
MNWSQSIENRIPYIVMRSCHANMSFSTSNNLLLIWSAGVDIAQQWLIVLYFKPLQTMRWKLKTC